LLRAALAYAGRSVPVFPCEPGAKRPLTRNGHWDATTDRRAIERWWRWQPSANIGLPTGNKNGIVVLDVDADGGGPESLAKLEREGAPVPETTKTRTGEEASTTSFATRVGRRSATALGCSVRGST
jgi:Bifunctional DNA primase/polymerase, N-terminal